VDMATEPAWRSWLGRSALVIDAWVAVALLLLVVVQVGVSTPDPDSARFLLFAPVVALPLTWRRRAPLVTVLVVSAAICVQSLIAEPVPAFGEFLSLMLVSYSVAAHAALREAVLGLLAVAVAVAVQGLRDPLVTSPFEVVYPVVYFGGAWLVGRITRRRRLHAVDLQQRAIELEQDREENARAAVAQERSRIAHELHDVIAHSVSVIVVQAAAAEEIAERDPTRTREALRTIRGVGNDALAEMRRLLGVLRNADDELALDPQPGVERLGELVGQAEAAGMTVHITVEGQHRPLPPGVNLTAYRVVQEALTNVRKHAHTSEAQVLLRYVPEAIELAISDNGRGAAGAPQPSNGAGHGLIGMRERVSLYGGTVNAGTRPNGGFSVEVRLPTDNATS
jgi:signal transduction histidine kinase